MFDAQDDFRALFEGAPDLMYTHDLHGVLTRVNRAFERVTGYEREEAVGKSFLQMIAASDREYVQELIFDRLGGATSACYCLTLNTKSGSTAQVEVTTELIFRDGQPCGIQGFGRDISQLDTFTRYLRLLHRLSTTNYLHLETLLGDYLGTGCEIFGLDQGVITSQNGTALARFGGAESDPHAFTLIATPGTLIVDEAAYAGTVISVDAKVWGAIGFWSGSGGASKRLHPQAREVIEMMARGIGTAVLQQQLTDQLAYQANHDALTDLPNRLMLQRELDEALRNAADGGKALAVAFIDLDRFKQINDTLGHAVGDVVLQQVALRLKGCIQTGDTLARMGGDEFTAILTGFSNESEIEEFARKLIREIGAPCKVGHRELFVTASVGISMFPKDGADAETLLRNADIAMYTAKSQGKNDVHFFSAEGSAVARRRLDMETYLRRALERQEFALHYQPQISLDGRLAGLEALLKWDSPELGSVPPSEFIPIAEDTGMILAIGSWVLQHTCDQIAAWLKTQAELPRIAVNVSAVQFGDPNFVDAVAQALSHSNIRPEALELEITESVIIRDVEASSRQMRRLRDLGVHIVIDDFGTGYSSLSYLRRFPANGLKIDKSFLHEADFGPGAIALIKAIVVLAHGLGLSVTAEGVETFDQMQAVRQAACDKAQGHLFGGGLSKQQVEALLSNPGTLALRMGL